MQHLLYIVIYYTVGICLNLIFRALQHVVVLHKAVMFSAIVIMRNITMYVKNQVWYIFMIRTLCSLFAELSVALFDTILSRLEFYNFLFIYLFIYTIFIEEYTISYNR